MKLAERLIGRCGIYCGACALYINGKCDGCLDPHTVECPIYKCVQSKGVNYCGECPEFPCERHYQANIAVYSPKYLDWKKREVNKHNE